MGSFRTWGKSTAWRGDFFITLLEIGFSSIKSSHCLRSVFPKSSSCLRSVFFKLSHCLNSVSTIVFSKSDIGNMIKEQRIFRNAFSKIKSVRDSVTRPWATSSQLLSAPATMRAGQSAVPLALPLHFPPRRLWGGRTSPSTLLKPLQSSSERLSTA